MLVPTGTKHMGTDMFNTVNKDVYGEYLKGNLAGSPESIGFGSPVDVMRKSTF